MPVDFSIKQVSDEVARRLRARAAGNRRSLQRELLTIVEQAVAADVGHARVGEPLSPIYSTEPGALGSAAAGRGDTNVSVTNRKKARAGSVNRKLSLGELWQRARKLGNRMPDESTAIVRRDRDARHGR